MTQLIPIKAKTPPKRMKYSVIWDFAPSSIARFKSEVIATSAAEAIDALVEYIDTCSAHDVDCWIDGVEDIPDLEQ